MKQEMIDIVKGIMLVIGLTSITIFICLRFIDKNYVYFLNYFQGENKYEIKITDDYHVSMDISVICKEEKCAGNYTNKISRNVVISKEDVKTLINQFNLKRQSLLETNEDKISDSQKAIITNVIR